MKRVIALLLALPLTACTTAQREGAKTGAAYGLLGSVTAAAVSTVLFGHGDWGNVVEAGVAGAAGGAAIGAASGAASDKSAKSGSKEKPVDVDKIRAKIGDVNFQAGVQMVQCKHSEAIKTAQRAFKEAGNKDEKLYALLIEAAAQVETGNDAAAEPLYAKMVETDPKRSLDKVKADTLSAVLKVQQLRREQDLPACR